MTATQVSEHQRPALALPSERVCAIDIGSKNLKLVVGYRQGGAIVTRRVSKRTLNLGAEVQASHGRIGRARLAELRAALRDLRRDAERQGASRVLAVGGNALRVASNRCEVLDTARELGVELEIANGRREGELGYLAATQGRAHCLVSDLGSHSLQVAWSHGGPIKALHVPGGYVSAYENFLRDSPRFGQASAVYRAYLEQELPHLSTSTARYVALSASSALRLATGLDKRLTLGRPVHRSTLQRRLRALESLSVGELRDLRTRVGKVEKVLPGLIFLDLIMELSGHERVRAAEAELPSGLIVEYFVSQMRAVRANGPTAPVPHLFVRH